MALILRHHGLGQAPLVVPGVLSTAVISQTDQPASVNDVLATLQAHNDRTFALTIVSTFAVATSAFFTLFRTLKLIREDKRG